MTRAGGHRGQPSGLAGGRAGIRRRWPNFIIPRTSDSGFALRLMLKDMRIALGMAEAAGTPSRLSAAAVDMWAEAAGVLPADAGHTEIARWLDPALVPRRGQDPPAS